MQLLSMTFSRAGFVGFNSDKLELFSSAFDTISCQMYIFRAVKGRSLKMSVIEDGIERTVVLKVFSTGIPF